MAGIAKLSPAQKVALDDSERTYSAQVKQLKKRTAAPHRKLTAEPEGTMPSHQDAANAQIDHAPEAAK